MRILGKMEEESMSNPPSFSPPEFPRAFAAVDAIAIAIAIAMGRAMFRVAPGADGAGARNIRVGTRA